MKQALEDLIKQLVVMIDINTKQKEELLAYVKQNPQLDPIFRHDIIHHCLLMEKLPERYDNESDFDFKSRVLQCRRRMDEQNRLAGCLLMAIEMLERPSCSQRISG